MVFRRPSVGAFQFAFSPTRGEVRQPHRLLMPSTRLALPLIHRLIPVAVLSSKVPFRGCVFKESVKVCTPKSPPFSVFR